MISKLFCLLLFESFTAILIASMYFIAYCQQGIYCHSYICAARAVDALNVTLELNLFGIIHKYHIAPEFGPHHFIILVTYFVTEGSFFK